ncbi:hypothetical protein GH733_019503 [Mirounga leonina]|nr:hypothetical protein GH733_019503 [Mirounga leonina]
MAFSVPIPNMSVMDLTCHWEKPAKCDDIDDIEKVQPPLLLRRLHAHPAVHVLTVIPVVLLVLMGQEVGEAGTLALEQLDELVGAGLSLLLLEHQLCIIHLRLHGHPLLLLVPQEAVGGGGGGGEGK